MAGVTPNPASLARLRVDDVSYEAVGRSSFTLCFLSVLLSLIFYCTNNRAVFAITMSFGFSVGDFIAAIELTKKIRKEFMTAPSQFKDISDEYEMLSSH